MNKILRVLFTILFLYLGYGVLLSQSNFLVLPQELDPHPPEEFFDYSGVFHIHRSARSEPMPERILTAAQEGGIDFLIMTTLDDFSKSPNPEGYYQNVMVLFAPEYSYLDSKIIQLNGETASLPSGIGQAQVLLSDWLSQTKKNDEAGMLVLAHPLKPGSEWNGDLPAGIDAMEVINLRALWQKAWLQSRSSFLWSLFIYPFNPRLATLRLTRYLAKEIHMWDQSNLLHPVYGFAGTDSEAKLSVLGKSVEFLSNETLFSVVRNHVLLESELTGNFSSDRQKILSALTKGNFFMAFDLLAPAKGFVSYMKSQTGKIFPMGSRVPLKEHPSLHISLPKKPLVPFETIVYKDGEKLMTSNSVDTQVEIHGTGSYRVMVHVLPTLPLPDGKKWFTWILSNTFIVN